MRNNFALPIGNFKTTWRLYSSCTAVPRPLPTTDGQQLPLPSWEHSRWRADTIINMGTGNKMPFNGFIEWFCFPFNQRQKCFCPNTDFVAFFRDIIFGKYLIILSRTLKYKQMCRVEREQKFKKKKARFSGIEMILLQQQKGHEYE